MLVSDAVYFLAIFKLRLNQYCVFAFQFDLL